MARLTIEDKWWSDPRRERLARLVGSLELADAMALRAWRLAQEFWGHGKKFVPLEIFNTLEAAPKLVEANLAKIEGDLVYVRGSSQYLSWLHEKRVSAVEGGKKSAANRREKYGSAVPMNATNSQEKPKQNRSETEVAPNSTEPFGFGSDSNTNNKSPLTPEGLREIWNQHRGELPECSKLNEKRKRHSQKVIGDNSDPNYWVEITKAISGNPYNRGNNDTKWVATFDYLVRPGKHLEIGERLQARTSVLRTELPKKTDEELLAEIQEKRTRNLAVSA
jgi:hypothetical protein